MRRHHRDIIQISGITDEQRKAWRQASGGDRRGLSSWIRAVADRAAAGVAEARVNRVDLDSLAVEIQSLRRSLGSSVGSNLNQIAYALNYDIRSGRAPNTAGHEKVLIDAVEELSAIRRRLNDALQRLEVLR